jgi:proteasome accessory factor B
MQNVIERVLNLLIFLLESPRPVTADEIRYTVQGYGQESDEAFHRMFERDKELLRNMGIPIRLDPMDAFEVEFGYTIDPEEYAVTDPGLTEEERVALSLAARMVRLGGSHLGLNALLKLGGMARVVGTEPLGADLGDGAAVLGDLFAAVTERRLVSFEYRGVTRTLEPWGIAHRRGHWYVTGKAKEGERNYRVDRMEKVVLSGGAGQFERPKGFDTKKLMDLHPWEAGGGDRVEATVRFDDDVAWWAARTLGETAPPEGDPFEAIVPVTNRDAFVGWVLSFGDAAEVVAPKDLRDEVVSRVRAALESVT